MNRRCIIIIIEPKGGMTAWDGGIVTCQNAATHEESLKTRSAKEILGFLCVRASECLCLRELM